MGVVAFDDPRGLTAYASLIGTVVTASPGSSATACRTIVLGRRIVEVAVALLLGALLGAMPLHYLDTFAHTTRPAGR